MSVYLADPDVTIHHGDSLTVLRGLPDESVHMAVTSPPFYGLRDYGVEGQIGLEETPDEWCNRLVDVFREVRRVLRSDGTCWVEVGSSFASGDTRPTRSRPGAPACGSDGTALPGSPAPGFACPDLCDGCLADYLSHRDRNERTIQPPARDAQQPEQTSRDSEHQDSGRADALAVPADAQESTKLASWLALRGECLDCASRAASVARIGLRSWLSGVDRSAHSSACNGGTTRRQRTSAGRTSDTEPSVLAWGHYTSTLKAKDLIPTPWMLAMSLQADGWYLRSDIVWMRPNPMPESVTDRPTKSHSYVFLLSRSARYFYDADAIREPHAEPQGRTAMVLKEPDRYRERGYKDAHGDGREGRFQGPATNPAGRNKRSVWTIPTQPLSETVRTVRWVPVPSSEAGDGTRRIPSPDCPVHAADPAARGTAPDDGRGDDASSRTGRTDGRLALARPTGDAATSGHSGPEHPRPGTAGEPRPGSAPAATPHSTPSDRTGPAPASDPPCTPSDRTSSRTDDTSAPPAFAETPAGTHESRTSPDDSAARPSDGRDDRTADSPSCTCSYEKKITEETGHYAAYPERLVEPCILAGTSEHGVCGACGAPWERETEKSIERAQATNRPGASPHGMATRSRESHPRASLSVQTTGWRASCACHAPTVPATILDPFLGSGTSAIVARRLSRRCIGIELNQKYCELAAERLAQQSLFAEEVA